MTHFKSNIVECETVKLEPLPRPHAKLACKYFSDSTVRVKFRFGPNFPWIEPSLPSWNEACEYAEILPGDPLY